MILAVLAAGAVLACTPGQGGIVATPDQVTWMADTWNRSARPALAKDLALRWDGARWQLDSTRENAANLAATAYFAQPLLDAAITLAVSRCDRAALDEVAQYYVAAMDQFATFGALAHRRGPIVGRLYPDDLVGDAATRTLPWTHPAHGGTPARLAECLLCVAQFLHPAARLARLFAVLPLGPANEIEGQFLSELVPLIVQDQVLRFAFVLPLDIGLPNGAPNGAVAAWRNQLANWDPKWRRYPAEMQDVHLWLLSEAAEVFAAHAAAPTVVPLAADDSMRMRDFLQTGTERFQRSETWRPIGHDSLGRVVWALDFFEGEFSHHRDDAFAGDTSPSFPAPADTAVVDTVGWDVSHATRFPLVLRSLETVRELTGEGFPADSALTAVARQLLWRVFNDRFDRPLFHNFMDGTDGWYRVGYAGRGVWGLSPSSYCDGRDRRRGCLGAEVLPSWGFLAAHEPGLTHLARRFIEMADATDSGTVAFRDRYYFSGGPFAFAVPTGARSSYALFELMSDFAPPGADWAGSNP